MNQFSDLKRLGSKRSREYTHTTVVGVSLSICYSTSTRYLDDDTGYFATEIKFFEVMNSNLY